MDALGVIVAVISGGGLGWLGKWLLDLLKQRDEGRRAQRKDAMEEVWKYAGEMKAHNERLMTVVDQHQTALEAQAAENADCRAETAELRETNRFLYDHLKRAFGAIHKLGEDPGALPELPPPRQRDNRGAEFLARQAAHAATLVKQASGVIQPPAGAAPPGGAPSAT